jgi:hypothetical protein
MVVWLQGLREEEMGGRPRCGGKWGGGCTKGEGLGGRAARVWEE